MNPLTQGASAPAVFTFNTSAVRVIVLEGDPWFIAGDLAETLKYEHVPHMLRVLDDDEKGVQIVDTPGGRQEVTVVSESGMFACVLKSRKPEAKPFRKWVTSEVLPAIRKTGRYETTAPVLPAPAPEPDRISANLRRRINQKAHALALEQYDTIHHLVEELVIRNLNCHASEADCADTIERFGSSLSGATLVNTHDLYELARQTTHLLDQAGQALAAIHRLEQHTGLKLYFRNDPAGLPESLCKKVFAAVQQYASQQAAHSPQTEQTA